MRSHWTARLSFALIVVAFLSAAAVHAQDAKPADVAGTWKWTMPGRDGATRDVALKLKQEGEKVTGTVTGFRADSPENPIEEAKVKGNELTFNVTREFNGNKFTTKYAAKIDGDALKGTITTPGRDGGEPRTREWTAKREKAASTN